jgi:ADP-ribose pyrophosphatase YjhB (NUDIX family)
LLLNRLVSRWLQSYWRLMRGLRLGAEACVVDGGGQVLLVRTGRGWCLPGGVVRKGETLQAALLTLLRDSYGIDVTSTPSLHWIYADDAHAPTDQAGLFVVRQWRQTASSSSAETAFFSPNALPEEIGPQTATRIRRALEGRVPP